MTGRDDAKFRLAMAATLARKAHEAHGRGEWREAALFARASIENAAKSVLACFAGVPRSHEPADILEEAAQAQGFPGALADEIARLIEQARPYGMVEHVLLSYGDERNHVDPWTLVTSEHATRSISVADDVVTFAGACVGEVFPELRCRERIALAENWADGGKPCDPRRMRPRPSALLATLALAACSSTARTPSGGTDGKDPALAKVAEPPRPEVRPNGPKIASIAMATTIYERPDHASKPLGLFRLGEALPRSEKPVPGDRCQDGWYAVLPKGYVCAGEDATLDLGHKIIRALGVKPDLSHPMPYTYGFVRANAALYHQVPSMKDQEHFEFAVKGHLAAYKKFHEKWNEVEAAGANHVPLDQYGNAKTLAKDELPLPPQPDEDNLFGNLEDGETPWWLRGRRQIPNISSFKMPDYAIFAGRVYRHAGLAVIGSFRADEKAGSRKFTVLLDGRLIGEDKIKPHYASPFHGIPLDGSLKFPFAMVSRPEATTFVPDEAGTSKWKRGDSVQFRDIIPLTGEVKKFSAVKYYETKDGRWLRYDQIAVFSEPPEYPKHFDYKTTKWIDVSIWQQTLVAYEGEKPIYATLVSTGVDGMGDPETTKSTIRGEFRIDYKHVTATMDADDPESRFELRDVPWVQYFERGYALHAAYWHDDFGRPRSHGCVNMSPIDARKIFFWTDPPLPEHWHAVRANGEMGPGTWVRVRGLRAREMTQEGAKARRGTLLPIALTGAGAAVGASCRTAVPNPSRLRAFL